MLMYVSLTEKVILISKEEKIYELFVWWVYCYKCFYCKRIMIKKIKLSTLCLYIYVKCKSI